jgi:DNA-binding beta-propeller fold protein YncE
VAAVDLQAMAVARHIALDGAPSDVLAAARRTAIYALVPADGAVHEIQSDRLTFRRKLKVGSTAVAMRMGARDKDGQEKSLYVLTSEPRALVRVGLDSFRVEARIALPENPLDLAVTLEASTAAVSVGSTAYLIDLANQKIGAPLGGGDAGGDIGAVRFRKDGKTLIVADRAGRRLSLYDVGSARLITHLPLAVRPDNLCFSHDGGQLFVTGEGLDAVVIVYPYNTPEVAETVLAGHAPGPMDTSESYVFIASPQSGDVSILEIQTSKVIGVVAVGSDPGFVKVTPDDQFALVLNRKSGDVAVLRVETPPRKTRLWTLIPVGTRPVSAVVKAV